MYKIIKDVILNGEFELNDILFKINTVWIERVLTDEEKTELETLAREKAKAENSYASAQTQIDNIYKELDNIKERIAKLENGQAEGEETTEPEPVEEYPEYKQPTGAHDAYHIGDKITYNGKKYICKLDNCVWSPDAYPQGWEEVVEGSEVEK